MAETQRFGLEKFGGVYGGAITDDGGKYSTIDRDTIDRLLYAFEQHAHTADPTTVALGDPGGAPTASTSGTGGTIPGGVTYYYKVSYIDAFGLETAASDEVSASTGAAPLATSAPIVNGSSADGQTLPAGTYYYALTALSSQGESSLGPQAIITVQPNQNGVLVTPPAMSNGITGYNVWRHGISDSGWTKVGINISGIWTDTGVPTGSCLTDPATQPPSTIIASVGTNSITVTVPDTTLVSTLGGDIRAWRLYRSDTSGNYGSNSLVAETVPADDSTPLVTSYTDTGGSLLAGGPLLISTTLTPSHRLFDVGTVLPATTGVAENSFFLHRSEKALYALINGAWEKVGGGGGGGSVLTDAPYVAMTYLDTDTLAVTPGSFFAITVPDDAAHVLSEGVDVVAVGRGLSGTWYADGGPLGASRIYTDGMWSVEGDVTVSGLVPGDVVDFELYLDNAIGSPDRNRISGVVPPGQTSVRVRNAGSWRIVPSINNSLWADVVPAITVWTAQTSPVVTWFSTRVVKELGPVTPITDQLPGVPQNVSAVANSDGSVSITWTDPATDGPADKDTPIRDYWIYDTNCQTLTGFTPFVAGGNPYTYTFQPQANLQVGVEQVFRVQARNFYGRGPYVETSGVTPVAPFPPPPLVALPFADEFNAGDTNGADTPLNSASWQTGSSLVQRVGGYVTGSVNDGQDTALLDTGVSNQDVTADFRISSNGQNAAYLILGRASDDDQVTVWFDGVDAPTVAEIRPTWLAGSPNTTNYYPGNNMTVVSPFTAFAGTGNFSTVRAVLSGTSVSIYQDGTLRATVTLAAAKTGTQAGFTIAAGDLVEVNRFAVVTS